MLSGLGLQDIQIRLLPAETMYKHYIENTKMDISILQLYSYEAKQPLLLKR